MAKGEDNYGSFGSVPDVLPQGGFSPDLNVKASPESMGAGIGRAAEQVGQEVESLALKQQGMQMETLATNADAAFVGKMGDIRGRYKSLTGMEAVNARPEYLAEAERARLEARKSLPPLAARAFDGMAMRTYGYAIGEINEYSAAQGKEAFNAAGSNLIATKALSAGDPSIALDDRRFGEVLGDIEHGTGMLLDPDHPGFQKDEDGQISGFNDTTPEGQILKSTHQNMIDFNKGEAYKNRYKTLAAQNPIAAEQKFEAEKHDMPPMAAVAIEASLAPKVTFAKSKNLTDISLVKANQDHAKFLLNPPTVGLKKTPSEIVNYVMNSLEGGDKLVADSGSIAKFGINQKWNPDIDVKKLTPETAAAYLKKKYWDDTGVEKLPPAIQMVAFDAFVQHGDDANTRKMISDANGDPMKLLQARSEYYSKLAADPKEAGNRKGWENRIASLTAQVKATDGVEPVIAPEAPVKPITAKPYATNPSGSPVSQTDYQLAHRDEILKHAAEESERLYPGNLAVAQKSRALIIQHISDNAQSQAAEYKQDNRLVQRAINGEFTGGRVPSHEELYSMQGVGDALQRSEVHSPTFTGGIDGLIAARSKSANKDSADFGADHFELMKKVSSHELNEPEDLIPFMDPEGKALSVRGYDHLSAMMVKRDKSPMSAGDVKDQTASYAYIKNMLATPFTIPGQKDLVGESLFLQATPRLEKWITTHEKDATMGEMSDPTNKFWMGNAISDLIRSHAQVITDATMAGVTPVSIEDQKKAFRQKYHATIFPEIKQQMLEDAIRRGLFAAKPVEPANANPQAPISE